MLTMLIGGLWHGANWTFVFWGGYHGLLLALYRAAPRLWDALPRAGAQALTFLLVLIGWVFFRSPTFAVAGSMLHSMFTVTPGPLPANLGVLAALLLIAGYWAMVGRNTFEYNETFRWTPAYQAAMAGALGACLALMAGGRDSPFLYFQF
jgi:alginate O-acetyltransferase complex protein AlgI